MTSGNLVVGFGLTNIDVLMVTDAITLQTKNSASHQMIQMGGVVSSALIVLSRLGIPTQLFSAVGEDMFGQTLLTMFKNEGVDTKYVSQISGMDTPLSAVILHNSDQRTIFCTPGRFATWKNPGFSQSLPASASYGILDGHNFELAREFMKTLNKKGIKTILDLGNPKSGLDELISKAWGVIIPQAYWKTLPAQKPEEIVKEFLTRGPQLVVLTVGNEGCFVGTKETIFHQPSWVVDAIDTNGAGDVFFGAFVYGLLNMWSLGKVAEFASAAAARSCTLLGKDNKIPHSTEEVFAFIKNHK